ncbi:NfeD family protein [Nocardia flavorosea]|uniref:NfeD family protein n=1 Tax=Nocardia flavorosea TaxID=53429 RepID=A0A846YA56_9NOCA|nr:NfeD family protein [Nocardia flavorosea]
MDGVAAIVWLVAGVLLAAAEMFIGELTLLMLGSAALLTAGVSFLTDAPVVVDAVVFAVSAVVLLLGVRPALLRRFGTPPPTPTNVDALTGKTALVLEPVGEHDGRVKLSGEVWSARSLDPGEEYPEGATVYVMKIDGATAVVWKGP